MTLSFRGWLGWSSDKAVCLCPARLVSRLRDPMTKSRDAGEDLIGRLGPDKGSGRVVGHRDVLADRGFKGARARVSPALDLFLGEGGEPALDEVQPRRAGGREVHA